MDGPKLGFAAHRTFVVVTGPRWNVSAEGRVRQLVTGHAGPMRHRLVAPALVVLAAFILTACAPSAEAQDKKACQDWGSAVATYAQGEDTASAASGLATKLTSNVIPEASPDLATNMKVIAKLIDRYAQTSTPAEIAASKKLGARCKAVGAPLSTD